MPISFIGAHLFMRLLGELDQYTREYFEVIASKESRFSTMIE